MNENINEKYLQLFRAIARNCEITAEKALDEEGIDKKKTEQSLAMRDDFTAISDKIANGEDLTEEDLFKLTMGAQVAKRTIDNNIKIWQSVSAAYTNDIIPKLQEVVLSNYNEDVIKKNFFEVPQV